MQVEDVVVVDVGVGEVVSESVVAQVLEETP